MVLLFTIIYIVGKEINNATTEINGSGDHFNVKTQQPSQENSKYFLHIFGI